MVSFKLHIFIVLLFSFFRPRGAAGKSSEWGLAGGVSWLHVRALLPGGRLDSGSPVHQPRGWNQL